LIVLLSVVVVLGVQLFISQRTLKSELSISGENYESLLALKDKYQEEERTILKESIQEVILLEWKQENYRKSIDNLRSKIKIKEDWMDNPQKYWVVKDGVVTERVKEVILETEE